MPVEPEVATKAELVRLLVAARKEAAYWKSKAMEARRELSLEDKDWRKFGLEEKEGLGYALEFLCDCANDERDFTLDMAQKVLRRLIGDEKDD